MPLLFICTRIKEHTCSFKKNPKRFIDPNETKRIKEKLFVYRMCE